MAKFKFNKYISSRKQARRFILIFCDSVMLFFAFFLGLIININSQENNLINLNDFPIFFLLLNLLFNVSFYLITNQYKSLTRFSSSMILYQIAVRNFFITFIFYLNNIVFIDNRIPFVNLILIWFLATSLMSIFRGVLKDFINLINIKKDKKISKIAIYGAGSDAYLLANSLDLDKTVEIIAFFDDNQELWGRSICGKTIYSYESLSKFVGKIDYLIFAKVSLEEDKKNKVLSFIKQLGFAIYTIPTFKELRESQKKRFLEDNYFSIEKLLGRDYIPPQKNLLLPSVEKKICCVTGAGGSVGSELVKQISRLKPTKLIAIEINEFSLYKLIQSIEKIDTGNVEITYILGDATKKEFIKKIFKDNNIDILFHAAAYKHVPLVESNPVNGIFNNVISTKNLCEEALVANIEKMIFISTDKAVRPTNIMGTSKRLGEIIVQSYSELVRRDKKLKTIYSIVRFGNVLGSSGSVIPLFKKQIKEGGPITLTHPEVIRYFMTLKEAVSLVLQTSYLSEGGDVFLLDMGKPVKIIDLAKQMIKLSGLSIRDEKNPSGDIAIEIIGLRHGEKLYEELLIDGKSEKTIHPLIFKAIESFIPFDELSVKLDSLESCLLGNNVDQTLLILKELVPEWQKSKNI